MRSDSKAIAIVASLGVILASVYALRFYIRSMHNRVGPKVSSFDLSFRDGLVLVPLGWRSSPSGCIRSSRSTPASRRSGRPSRWWRPDDWLLAQATVKGPEINWEALSPAIALTVGACVVLIVGWRGRGSCAGASCRCLTLVTLP